MNRNAKRAWGVGTQRDVNKWGGTQRSEANDAGVKVVCFVVNTSVLNKNPKQRVGRVDQSVYREPELHTGIGTRRPHKPKKNPGKKGNPTIQVGEDAIVC